LAELFDGGFHAGAGGPDIVKENVGGVGVDFDFWVEAISGYGLSEASLTVGANLDSILVAEENPLDFVVAEFGKMFGN
jgi:hypothetical protein